MSDTQKTRHHAPPPATPGLARMAPAMSTPLASIFGSGFLVVVPVLASAVGSWAPLAMIVVALVAFGVGAIVRHNIQCAEPVLAAGERRTTVVFERVSDVALVGAYVISVCLYVHILSAFVLTGLGLDTEFNKSLMTSAVIGAITVIGLFGGLGPLERMERWALYMTLAILGVLLVGFAWFDFGLIGRTDALPVVDWPGRSPWQVATIVAGTLIIVQGFETTRYLGGHFDADTRIRASRWSQYFSLSVYVVFVALAMPVLPALNGQYGENSLIALAGAVALWLPVPLIAAAALSQFSAAVADIVAAAANLEEASRHRVTPRWGYLAVGLAAMALAWTGSTFTIIALASRAFAFYYLLQCVVAFSVCRNNRERAKFIAIGAVLAFVLVFAVPAG